MALRVIDCQIVMFRGKLFSTNEDMEFQAKNLQKHFVNCERSIFQTFWKVHCCAKSLFFELETSNCGNLLTFLIEKIKLSQSEVSKSKNKDLAQQCTFQKVWKILL